MIKFILILVAIFLIRKFFSTIGKPVGVFRTNQNTTKEKNLGHEQQSSVYSFDKLDLELINKDNLSQIQHDLNIILSYVPYFKIKKFLDSASKSLLVICEFLTSYRESDTLERTEIDKLSQLVNKACLKDVLKNRNTLYEYANGDKKLILQQTYLLSNRAFISVSSSKCDWTFSKQLNSPEPNWILSNIRNHIE